ncbi:hypothetical protein AB0C34_01365 [Nocardia sp. NPDC049220]|uniref:hypothetical protein n=1 Tax=Nocardia sp. NPDC049220 TaxID=3155273 RepID=UPI0033FE855E
MAPGDSSNDDGAEISSGSPGGEPVDAPPHVRGRTDPSLDSVWLGLRSSPLPSLRHGPRWSTVVLAGAFLAVLVLYIVVRR